jgi:hypothetical protein
VWWVGKWAVYSAEKRAVKWAGYSAGERVGERASRWAERTAA